MPRTLRLILGDQLNRQHSWLKEVNDEVTYVMMETRSETDYVRHHIQKVIGFFLAMRAFAQELRDQGHRVKYYRLDDSDNQGSFSDTITALIQAEGYERFAYQLPDEYRLDQELKQLAEDLACPVAVADTEHFLTDRMTVKELFAGKKTYLMETFYRQMRQQYNILMEEDGETPLTGKWNYDQANRKKMPKDQAIPPAPHFQRSVQEMVDWLKDQGVETIGTLDPSSYRWPVNRGEGLAILKDFCENRLADFGRFQDAMTDRHFLLFHSMLSFVMNTKMLSPLEVVETCVDYWRDHQDEIDIAQIEGFVRQIIGWREFMRGVYWAQMPNYAKTNFFAHDAPLPSWYWTGKTKMKCLQHAIGQSLEEAYAHHIQRLMVTGNFALLLGVHPDEVDQWYLGIYMDAIEWVEMTNTRGMSQYADGGLLATKPYVASANYMHKMGDYCSNCAYRRQDKLGEKACPFNTLYWDFMDRHRGKLENNPRIGMAYRTWDRMDSEKKEAILEKAAWVKEHIEEL